MIRFTVLLSLTSNVFWFMLLPPDFRLRFHASGYSDGFHDTCVLCTNKSKLN